MKLDKRYTFTSEFCGFPQRRHVARFCGEFIGSAQNKRLARKLAIDHRREFLAKISK